MYSMISAEVYWSVRNTNPVLNELKTLINWDGLSQVIQQQPKTRKSNAGRIPYDPKMMLKILILQEIYNLSDDSTEMRISNDISFKYFLDLDLLDKSPDAKTIWKFKETLRKNNAETLLFEEFHRFLEENKLRLSKGSIVDASFVKVPVQRNSKEENEQIKNGEVPKNFEENPHKKSQKDTDARWTKKNGKSHYGYKNHVATATNKQFISKYEVTPANVHDSQVLEEILPEESTQLYGDSAYRSQEISDMLEEKGVRNFVQHRKYRNTPLTEKQISCNRRKSKTRSKVEHIFAWFRNCMNRGLELRCIGIERVRFRIGIRNTCYNMLKYLSLKCA